MHDEPDLDATICGYCHDYITDGKILYHTECLTEYILAIGRPVLL